MFFFVLIKQPEKLRGKLGWESSASAQAENGKSQGRMQCVVKKEKKIILAKTRDFFLHTDRKVKKGC